MLGQKIRELRRRRGFVQKDLAELLEISTATVAMWENGKRKPDIETVSALAKIFDTTIDWLLGADENTIAVTLPKVENSVTIMHRGGKCENIILDDSQIEAVENFVLALSDASK